MQPQSAAGLDSSLKTEQTYLMRVSEIHQRIPALRIIKKRLIRGIDLTLDAGVKNLESPVTRYLVYHSVSPYDRIIYYSL